MVMILAFQASDCGSNPGLVMIFYLLFLLFSVCFCCFYLIFFSFFSFTASTIRQLMHLCIKSQKARYILYCVQKFSIFLCSHSSCLHNRAIFDPTNEVLCSKICLQGIYYISHNLLFKLRQIVLFITKTNC